MINLDWRGEFVYVNNVCGRKKVTSYKSPEDKCAACGRRGGSHHTSDSISWCYSLTTRNERNDPKFHTSFSYDERNANNPNKTFIRKY